DELTRAIDLVGIFGSCGGVGGGSLRLTIEDGAFGGKPAETGTGDGVAARLRPFDGRAYLGHDRVYVLLEQAAKDDESVGIEDLERCGHVEVIGLEFVGA